MNKYFKHDEFRCPCCKIWVVKPDLEDLLFKIREDFGEAIVITSGYRCEKHNAKVGGVKNSTHCLGLGADIRPVSMDTEKFDELLKSCQKFSWNIGNGINKGFVHVDARSPKRDEKDRKIKREWSY